MIKKAPFFRDYFILVYTNRIRVNKLQYVKFKLFKSVTNIYWPVHKSSIVFGNIRIGINSNVGANPGCYIQGIGEIVIGNYTLLAENVGIISANHDIYDYRSHHVEKVIIGDYCWIGMNSVVLPGVILGNHTIVGAGSVVTKSFEEGYCIIGGCPAKVIKRLERNKCIDYKDEFEYYGFLKKQEFEKYYKKYF